MSENKQNLIDVQQLKRYPEFYALKMQMEEFCERMDSISDINLDDVSRVSLDVEVFGRRFASDKIRELLSTLGLVDKSRPRVIDRTGE